MITKLGNRSSDNFRVIRSGKITLSESDDYAILRLPKKALLTGLWIEIVTASTVPVTGTPDAQTIKVGFTGNGESADDDFFAQLTAGATPATLDSKVTGVTDLTKLKWFDKARGTITVTTDVEDAVIKAVVRLWAQYSVIN